MFIIVYYQGNQNQDDNKILSQYSENSMHVTNAYFSVEVVQMVNMIFELFIT